MRTVQKSIICVYVRALKVGSFQSAANTFLNWFRLIFIFYWDLFECEIYIHFQWRFFLCVLFLFIVHQTERTTFILLCIINWMREIDHHCRDFWSIWFYVFASDWIDFHHFHFFVWGIVVLLSFFNATYDFMVDIFFMNCLGLFWPLFFPIHWTLICVE